MKRSATHQPNFIQDKVSSYGSLTPVGFGRHYRNKIRVWIDCYGKVVMSERHYVFRFFNICLAEYACK